MDMGIYNILRDKILLGFFEYCFVKVEQFKVQVLEKNIVLVWELMLMFLWFGELVNQVIVVIFVNLFFGYEVVLLLVIEEYYLMVGEVVVQFGCIVNKIGCVVNKYNLKIEQYGKFFLDKLRYLDKQVEVFCYNVEGVQVFCYLIYGVDVV